MLKDIYSFINSSAIAKHLENIGYVPTPTQAAGIIYSNNRASLAEKHIAWRELIESTEDTQIEDSPYTLHQLLENQIKIEDECIKDLYNEAENTLYCCYHHQFKLGFCKNIEDCFDMIKKYHLTSELCCISKIDLGAPEQDSSSVYVYNGKIIDILSNSTRKFACIFTNMYKDLPIPFEKGDIVYMEFGYKRSNPFIFIEKNFEPPTDDESCINGNFVSYKFIYDDGSITKFYEGDFINVEYYHEELTGIQRLLIPLSSFIKNKIDVVY